MNHAQLWQDAPVDPHHTEADGPPVAAPGEFEAWLAGQGAPELLFESLPCVPFARLLADSSERGEAD